MKKKGIAICRDGKDRGATRAPAVQRDDCANKRNNRRREGGGTRRFEGGAGEGTRRRSTENATSQRTPPRILGFGFSVVQADAEGEEKDQPSAGSTHRIDSLEIPIGFDREGQNRKEEWRRASGFGVCPCESRDDDRGYVRGSRKRPDRPREVAHEGHRRQNLPGGGTPPTPAHHRRGGGCSRWPRRHGECRRRKEGRGGDIRAGAIIRDRESSAVCSWFLVAPPPRR